jgi:hypothetical protein
LPTPNAGLYLVATNSPDYEANGPWAGINATSTAIDTSLYGVEHITANGAIANKEGLVILDAASALTGVTLALPTSGSIASGGDDGKRLTIIGKTAHAHVVTTPSNGINGGDLHATFAAAGDHITLRAFGGVWYTEDNNTTLS